METPKRYCRKCLLRDMDEGEYFKNLYDYIARLDEDVRAEDEIYHFRLDICRQCERLLNGMCSACGCYVELRAAISVNSCPYDLWKAVKKTEID